MSKDQRVNTILNLLPEGGRMLDLGCGDGKISIGVLTKKNCNVLAIDKDPGRLFTLTTNISNLNDGLLGDIEILEKDFYNYDVKGDFDMIVSFASLGHFKKLDRSSEMIKHLQNKTRKGGYNFISIHLENPKEFEELYLNNV